MEEFLISKIRKINPRVPKEFSLTANFKTDLGLDSLDLIEWVAVIEQKYQLEIPDKDFEQFISIQHTITYLTEHIG